MCEYLIDDYFFFNDTATTEIYTLSLHDALPICVHERGGPQHGPGERGHAALWDGADLRPRPGAVLLARRRAAHHPRGDGDAPDRLRRVPDHRAQRPLSAARRQLMTRPPITRMTSPVM